MKKTIFLTGLILSMCCSCINYKLNLAFKLMGVYDDTIKISKLTNYEKVVIFIPMHHLGTEFFYKDVQSKIDSLKLEGYFFYTEEVKGDKRDSITIRKSIKISGMPFSKNNLGYKAFFDSVYKGKVKFKKELINQPSSKEFGLDEINSRKVDVSLKEMIDYYESKYGEIKLEPCDFKRSFYEKTECPHKRLSKEVEQDVYLDFRNRNVIETLKKDQHKKIAIVYGGGHLKGIRKELLKLGYK